MKTSPLFGFAILAIFAMAATGAFLGALREEPFVSRNATAEAGALVEPPEPRYEPVDDPDPVLVAYVDLVLVAWRPRGEPVDHLELARSIARACLAEPPLFRDDEQRARTAILIATLAWFEGGLQRWVDDGRCNAWMRDAWRAGSIEPNYAAVPASHRAVLRGANCDGGNAWSLWQIHPEGGIRLTEDGEWTHDRGGLHGPDLVADRVLAARVAIAFVRKSFRVTAGTLCGYAGGGADGCRKAGARTRFAEAWWRGHPIAP